jgi:hypothetical protein
MEVCPAILIFINLNSKNGAILTLLQEGGHPHAPYSPYFGILQPEWAAFAAVIVDLRFERLKKENFVIECDCVLMTECV